MNASRQAAEQASRAVRRARASMSARHGRPRTHQPVRRDSRYRGEREGTFWRKVDPLQLRAILEAAKLQELATKEHGKRIGDLGQSGIQVLEFLIAKVEWEDGTLEPSYREIKARTGLSINCIAKALRRLRDAGFLEWMRRSEPVEDDENGVNVKQIENAYRILVPAKWAARIAMRVAGWVQRGLKAAQQWRDPATDLAARAAWKAAERLRNFRAWAANNISDPVLRSETIAAEEAHVAIHLK